jgi:transcription antitermination factor NusG
LKAPGHEVFIPYLSYSYDGRGTVFNVMEGYAFVASGLDDRMYLDIVHSSPYLKGVLHSQGSGSLVLLTVPNSNVLDLKDRLSKMVAVEIQEGMEVEITRGICQGLSGKVVGLEEDVAHILISLRTLKTIRTIPRFALLPIGENEDV